MSSDTGIRRIDIDDQDPRVVYSTGWGSDTTASAAYDGTLHSATLEGLTASFTFTGTLVAVMGCGGDTRESGYPTVSFLIDGTSYGFREDSTALDGQYYNVTWFVSPELDSAEHTLVITNLNGTRPSTFWLDRFWYISADETNTTSSVVPPAATSSSPPPNNGSAGHSQNLGAIIGGSVGGAAALALLVGLGVYLFKRRSSQRRAQGTGFTPYAEAREAPLVGNRPQIITTTPTPTSDAPESSISEIPVAGPSHQ
ncbi:hypothetical protein C2E23DRAFT_39732 [Lenzites betulinus]|nr:hypothetical protein C2E23DRAFT_39732 [Lenzites betulinus]